MAFLITVTYSFCSFYAETYIAFFLDLNLLLLLLFSFPCPQHWPNASLHVIYAAAESAYIL